MSNKIIQIAATSGEFATSSRLYALDSEGNIYLCRGTDADINWLEVPCPIGSAEKLDEIELIPIHGKHRTNFLKRRDFEKSCNKNPPLVETITNSKSNV